jgi:hypothetical protein
MSDQQELADDAQRQFGRPKQRQTYELVAGEGGAVGIKCLRCGLVSWNVNDVANRYCGRCHRFHEDSSRP